MSLPLDDGPRREDFLVPAGHVGGVVMADAPETAHDVRKFFAAWIESANQGDWAPSAP